MGLVAGVRRGLQQWQSTTTQKSHLAARSLVLVVNNSSLETPCWVNSSASDWDCGQVYHEHSKSNGEWCQNLQKLIPTQKHQKKK
ncbi:hypothetical protein CICLE_v10002991mg [Citrus x clementina]|uniref:Uncharacterized protein n=1 Tax=Citrus clementina TaxID=85681 RepID=V4T0D4_CITCL|nr:hypothetical protein CICLE_v10002991mg [Citrus x clementina]